MRASPRSLAEVTNLTIPENVFTNNHSNTTPFGDSGGQIDLTVCTKNALIWKNTFQDGSASPNGTTADGIELHGTYISLIDNIVKNNSGDGISMDGVQHILISNSDPRTGSFGNGLSGIEIAHSAPRSGQRNGSLSIPQSRPGTLSMASGATPATRLRPNL